MEPPTKFPSKSRRGYSACTACDRWLLNIATFRHEQKYWSLCRTDWEDYWFNTEELSSDYQEYK